MSKVNSLVLHGFWCSPYAKRVEIALKLKGIPFEYVEEDLRNKSTLLLKYNPIHKKVPILVHNGNPIVESYVILEYIDETWSDKLPRLLPEEPYNRARFRFWATYIQQLYESIEKLIKFNDKDIIETAINETHEKLDVLEENMKDFFIENPRSGDGENVDLLDIMIASSLGGFRALEEILEIKILDHGKHPLIYQWVMSIVESKIAKEIGPPHESVVSFLREIKQYAAN